ncbi:hypothetical protein BX616_001098 [Lobosporangium transversale]|uniref:Carboxyphosphonoenolpyruvate phosphonomutase-like protein n=1 Tax=Lobosporangium transversale TaxID=64571 RepID=A0A1Y2H072_9FUNG|nr:carboxyphosphonoenolpyruvate phosphonomutase-like protein [Lobosporangium transversale]KAF9905093.1 hypothetical protein BX616_001098 [Lobosporangium transversale]ORZ27401.1 carboxyphosphonoenolpyruvate phosphonomutase-like protein [Lobosporangium transversale]|eukprot:XP_021885128.1 carboxyphosphonoenolpyruvate phosphonomutase-like protein [Lobosporangium transversale]
MSPSDQNAVATHFRALHKPGNPLILGNVYDAATASIIVSVPSAKAVATASFAIAAAEGVNDEDLTHGYDDVKATIKEAIALGVVGCNLEDVDNKTHTLRTSEDAVHRIKLALEAAKEAGVPEFAVNARTDVLGYGGSVEDAIERGKAFLAAGANTVFVWGGPRGRGVSREEVKELATALDGRLNVLLRFGEGYLTVQELREIGVARISVGPGLFRIATNAYREAAESLLGA